MTLGKLEEIDAFRHTETIQEISGKASSEASLETILRKVEEAWKTLEFPVLPYKDFKDVFILGGTDEIQVQLDDSTLTWPLLQVPGTLVRLKQGSTIGLNNWTSSAKLWYVQLTTEFV